MMTFRYREPRRFQPRSRRSTAATFVCACALPADAQSHPIQGIPRAYIAHAAALDLAVSDAGLRVSPGLGQNPVASVGIRIGLEIGELTAVVGAAVLDLARATNSDIFCAYWGLHCLA